jgi:cobyrinic acid a,c-diamide synthase
MASDGPMQPMTGRQKGFVIAGPASGVGKTTVTLSVMAALRKRGFTVQPFKCGPDFIDAGHHTRVCERATRNLDGWMLSADANRRVFYRNSLNADVCVVEGMMGLFDGVDGKSEAGSTAEIAKWLGLPVILIVDAFSMARSAAALVHGFEAFDPAVKIEGVIFNRVGGAAHYRMLKDALTTNTNAVPLGYLPGDERIRIPERYLGLVTAGENSLPDPMISLLCELAEHNIDLDELLERVTSIAVRPKLDRTEHPSHASADPICVGVARDKAFCFYYEDNLDVLREAGAKIVEFSPLGDSLLPNDLDALYFGGGYPELFAKQLTENRSMLTSIRRAAEEGRPIYAECGGLMYLAKEIVTKEGSSFPMAGVLPITVQMTDRLINFGYTEVSFTSDCLIGIAGGKARGHSFHCSRIVDAGPIEHVYRTRNSMTGGDEPEGLSVKSVLASYVHIHFLSCPGTAETFVKNVQRARRREPVSETKKRQVMRSSRSAGEGERGGRSC